MPNIASILKAEISRVARKEVRAEIEALKKASVEHRASIAELRRQVRALEKELRRVAKGAMRPATTVDSGNEVEPSTKRRFSAARLAAHRAKLGVSAASYGQLVGVSGQTVYHWEQGKARPRAAQLESLAAVRKLGVREVTERLSSH
jgi:DNA-binding transcriptional regulator YiaG